VAAPGSAGFPLAARGASLLPLVTFFVVEVVWAVLLIVLLIRKCPAL
jgi:hypothetical protein